MNIFSTTKRKKREREWRIKSRHDLTNLDPTNFPPSAVDGNPTSFGFPIFRPVVESAKLVRVKAKREKHDQLFGNLKCKINPVIESGVREAAQQATSRR